MRVYIISCVYPPEVVTEANTARDIADAMTQRGHDVTVFAPFPNRPTGKVMSGYRRSLRHVEQRDGYRIIYSWHTVSKNSTLASRTAENVTFGLSSTWQLMREPKPDVVFMNTWPICAEWMNMRALTRHNVPVICVVKDLYPETLAHQMHDQHPVMRLTHAISSQIYHDSTIVAPLNPLMSEHIIKTRGLSPNKTQVIQDWVDASQFPKNKPKNGNFRQKYDLSPDLFLAMYVGSMTRMAGLELYVETAQRLRSRPDIRLLLVGDGSERDLIETMIREKNLDNIQMIYPLQPDDVPDVQAAADTLMFSLLPGAAEHTTPSKLIFYMFSQRPILANVNIDSSPADIIHTANCGYVMRQGDPDGLAAQLERMADDRPSLQQLGDNARAYAEENFLKDSVLPHVCDLLEQTAGFDSHVHDTRVLTTVS